MIIIRKPCAPVNFSRGRNGHSVAAIVIHLIDGSQAGCDAHFASPAAKVSAHYSISKAGSVHQYVDETDTAFHAGRIQQPTAPLKRKADGSFWNPNLYTVGIEHEGRPNDEWPAAMRESSALLVAEVARRHNLPSPLARAHVWMHREVFSAKSCPGNRINIDTIIERANQLRAAQPGVVPQPARGPLTVRTQVAVNVRNSASTGGPVLRVIRAATNLAPQEAVAGQTVSGNPNWYRLAPGEFIWAGATDRPLGEA